MTTPTAEKLRIFLPSKELAADDDPQTVGEATSVGTVTTIIDTSLTQADDFWNGAIGFWLFSSPTVALRGTFFHVLDFVASTDTITTYKDMAAAPAIGDDFVLFLGGGFRSDQEAFGLLSGGVMPELSGIAGTNVTGITTTYASPGLGAGDVNIAFDFSTSELTLTKDGEAPGVAFVVTGDISDQALFAADGQSYVRLTIVQASLPGSDQNDDYTLSIQNGTLTPDYEGLETNNVNLGKTRYRLEVPKNTDGSDAMVNLTVFSSTPGGTASVISTGQSLGLTDGDFFADNVSDWPTRGFWVKNNTLNDCRYVNYRSGNQLFCFGVDWAILTFDAGVLTAAQNATLTSLTSGGTATIDQQVVQSGTFGGSDAVGFYLLKNVSGSFLNNDVLQVSAVNVSVASANKADGLRDKVAQAWSAADNIAVMSDVDLAVEAPSTLEFTSPTTEIESPEVDAPTLAFTDANNIGEALAVTSLALGDIYGVWRREWLVDDTKPRSNINTNTNYSWS